MHSLSPAFSPPYFLHVQRLKFPPEMSEIQEDFSSLPRVPDRLHFLLSFLFFWVTPAHRTRISQAIEEVSCFTHQYIDSDWGKGQGYWGCHHSNLLNRKVSPDDFSRSTLGYFKENLPLLQIPASVENIIIIMVIITIIIRERGCMQCIGEAKFQGQALARGESSLFRRYFADFDVFVWTFLCILDTRVANRYPAVGYPKG